MPSSRHRWDPVAPAPRGLVAPVRLDPQGLTGPTRGAARGPGWRRSSQGLYVPAEVDADRPEQRIVEQAARLPAGGAVTGWAAFRLHGAAFFDGLLPDGRTRLPVPLVTDGHHVRGDADAVLVRDRIDPSEIVVRHGLPTARVERALFDAMRCRSLREAVVGMDMVAAADLVSVRRMRAYLATRRGQRGVRIVARALDLASELSRSPNETRMRLIWVLDARLPPPLVNQPVFDLDGRLLAIVDLLDVERGVVGEYDGADHRSARRHSSDVGREDALRGVGLEVFRVTGPDLPLTDRVVSRMHAARGRARGTVEAAWTVTPPPWWDLPPTLDELLDRRDVWRSLHESA